MILTGWGVAVNVADEGLGVVLPLLAAAELDAGALYGLFGSSVKSSIMEYL